MDRFVGVTELSQALSVKPSTIYAWVQIGYVPHYRLGRRVAFKLPEIERWLEERHHRGRRVKIQHDVNLPESVRRL